jgi:hypothetical protein
MKPRAFLLTLVLALLFVASPAFAVGTFRLKSNELTEVSGAWHVFVAIELPKAPATKHQTMRFVFTQIAMYDRSLVDGKSEPVTNRQEIKGRTPSVESQDVDFGDVRGKIWPKTSFDFGLTRQRGYEAGEYKMELKTSDDQPVGSAVTIILKGDNPVVDRRTIAFNAKDKSIRKVDTGLDGGTHTRGTVEGDTAANPGMGEVTPTGTAAPFIPADAYNRTPEEDIKVKPKSGCGVGSLDARGLRGPLALPVVGVVGLGILVLRRRRAARR